MSRWWPETFRVHGAHAPVDVSPSLALQPATVADGEATVGVARAAKVRQALERRLDRLQAPRGSRLVVWLGPDAVGIQALPWQPSLVSPEAIDAYAHHCFVETYGSSAQAWHVRASEPRVGQPFLACGISAEVTAAIEQVLAARGLRLAGLKPTLIAAFNRHLRRLRRGGGTGWLVMVDAGWLTLMQVVRGIPVAVRTLVRGAVPLRALLERECRVTGQDAVATTVWMLGTGTRPLDLDDALDDLRRAGWIAEQLDPLLDDVDLVAARKLELQAT